MRLALGSHSVFSEIVCQQEVVLLSPEAHSGIEPMIHFKNRVTTFYIILQHTLYIYIYIQNQRQRQVSQPEKFVLDLGCAMQLPMVTQGPGKGPFASSGSAEVAGSCRLTSSGRLAAARSLGNRSRATVKATVPSRRTLATVTLFWLSVRIIRN